MPDIPDAPGAPGAPSAPTAPHAPDAPPDAPDAPDAAAEANAIQLALALKHVDELANRERSRIVCVYGLSPQLPGTPAETHQLSDLFAFGRFSPHVESASSLLPRPVFSADGVGIELPGNVPELGHSRVALLVTPRNDSALVLDAPVREDPDAEDVAKLLEITCLKRDQLRIHGLPILDWLRDKAEATGLQLPANLELGRNVHQCVFPGGSLLKGIRDGDRLWRLVYRVAAPTEPDREIGIFRPPHLNYPGLAVVGHGRGVAVVAGFAESVENAYILISIMFITGLDVLRRTRHDLFDAITAASKSPITSDAKVRNLISQLPAQLNELQLDLEFGVESYLDSTLLPEFVIETFQQSLCEAMGVRVGLEHSSRMLDRLTSVINAQRLALDAAAQEQTERRDRLFSGLLAAGSIMALPPALLLAFFALTPETRTSMFNLRAHWAAYLLAWLPFILLIFIGWILRRRIRTSSRGAA
jgi:hypothetical protein